MKKLFAITCYLCYFSLVCAQTPVGLEVDSNLVVLFGNDTLCCGPKFIWLPSKKAALVGEMVWPYDSIWAHSFSTGKSMASGNMSSAFGQSLAVGDYAFAVGASGAAGDRSFAAGNSTAFGMHATALCQSSANGRGALAAGFSTADGIVSVALGNAHAAGNSSAALNLSRADAFMSTAIGRYNLGGGSATEYVSTDPIFEVGIGSTESNRANAFTIRKDGFISMGNHLAHTKFALYQLGATTYGMGVVAGQFRFNIGNPQARYAFFDQPGSMATEVFTILGNGNVTALGTVSSGSDRNRKTDIAEVDYQKILSTLDNLKISEWRYIGEQALHIGPMAQDFSASFGLGDTDTGIATVDADGVALAAIKALIKEMEAMKLEIQMLKKQLAGQDAGIDD